MSDGGGCQEWVNPRQRVGNTDITDNVHRIDIAATFADLALTSQRAERLMGETARLGEPLTTWTLDFEHVTAARLTEIAATLIKEEAR